MKDKRSLHLKIQELCDCYATTDPLKEMSELKEDKEIDEASLKWLALSILHGINSNARQISLSLSGDGKVKVTAEYRKADLPNPGAEIGEKVIEAMKEITHLEGDKGELPLAVGVRDGSVEIKVKLEKTPDGESVTLEYPE